MRGHLREGAKWLDDALDGGTAATAARGKALGASAQLAYRLGAFERARILNAEAMAICETLGDRAGIGRTLNRLADVAEADGDLDEARALWEKSVAVAREAGDQLGFAIARGNLGSVHLTRGNYEGAVSCTEDSLRVFRGLGHVHGTAVALENLGSAAVRQGRYADAVPPLRESLMLFQRLGSPVYLAHAMVELAAVMVLNDTIGAARLLGAVDAVLSTTGGRLSPDTQQLFDRVVADTRGRMDTDLFDRTWAAGREAGLDQALESALAAAPPPRDAAVIGGG